MPNRGTPQGALLSPLAFRIGVARLSRQLESIPDLGYALYADITLWTTRGSLGYKENTLQEAVQTSLCGELWRAAPEKSELVRVHGRGYRNEHPFDLKISDHGIREVEKPRILGLRVQSIRHADHTHKALRTTVKQTSRMVHRVTFHNKGFGEADTSA